MDCLNDLLGRNQSVFSPEITWLDSIHRLKLATLKRLPMKALEWFHIDSTRSFLSNWVEISSDLSEIPLSDSINSNENQIGAGRFPIFFLKVNSVYLNLFRLKLPHLKDLISFEIQIERFKYIFHCLKAKLIDLNSFWLTFHHRLVQWNRFNDWKWVKKIENLHLLVDFKAALTEIHGQITRNNRTKRLD